MDFKTFNFSGKKVGIGVMETTSPSYAFGRKDELLSEILILKEAQGLDALMFCVVDILNEQTTAFAPSEDEIAMI